MDSTRVSEAPNPGSIPGKATTFKKAKDYLYLRYQFYNL